MKIKHSKYIPFKGFQAIVIFGVLYVRKDTVLSERSINHERIHFAQGKEMTWVGFYLWYFFEWIIRLFQYGFSHKAYRNISFEREAYSNQDNSDYLKNRKIFNWINYL